MYCNYSLSRQQQRALIRRIKKESDGHLRTRMLNVLNYASGMSLRETAVVTGSSAASVQRHNYRFKKYGHLGLLDRRADNGEKALPKVAFQFLSELITKVPKDYGYCRSTWTREIMARLLDERIGIDVSVSTIGRALKILGIVWRRARPILLSPLPKRVYSAHKGKITRLKKIASIDEPVFYVDEADVHLNPKIGNDWMPRGRQKKVRTPGPNRKRFIAGALNATTGNIIYVIRDNKKSSLFIDLLAELSRRHRRAKTMHLIVDNYSIHSSNLTKQVLLEYGKRFKLHFLPIYGQDLNRIELLWKQMHENVTRNHRCESLEELVSEVDDFLQRARPFTEVQPSLNMVA